MSVGPPGDLRSLLLEAGCFIGKETGRRTWEITKYGCNTIADFAIRGAVYMKDTARECAVNVAARNPEVQARVLAQFSGNITDPGLPVIEKDVGSTVVLIGNEKDALTS